MIGVGQPVHLEDFSCVQLFVWLLTGLFTAVTQSEFSFSALKPE